jgi:uncharacterized protein (TIGR03083 family)
LAALDGAGLCEAGAVEATDLLDALGAASVVVASPEVAAAWTAPSALAGYTVGGLAAHLLTAIERTVAVLAADPPSGARVVGLPEFYGPNRIDDEGQLASGLPAFLREDAEGRAEREGRDGVVAAFETLAATLAAALEAADADRLVAVVQVPGGAASLADYVVTRLVELVVHTDDLAASVGLDPPPIAPSILRTVTAAFVELAVARAGAVAVMRAFTRRERGDADVLRVL